MTQDSYTAWDDKQYVWPPPEGWYQASDGKWWPEGYGPSAEAAQAGGEAQAVADTAQAATEAIDDSTAGLAGGAAGIAGVAGIAGAATGMADDVGGQVADAAGQAGDLVGGIGGVGDAATGAVGGVADAATGAVGGVTDAASGAVGGVTDAASGLAGGVADAATGAVGGVTDAASGAVGGVADAASGVAGGVADGATGAVGGVTDAATGAVGAVGDAASAGAGAFQNAPMDMNDLSGSSVVDGIGEAAIPGAGEVPDISDLLPAEGEDIAAGGPSVDGVGGPQWNAPSGAAFTTPDTGFGAPVGDEPTTNFAPPPDGAPGPQPGYFTPEADVQGQAPGYIAGPGADPAYGAPSNYQAPAPGGAPPPQGPAGSPAQPAGYGAPPPQGPAGGPAYASIGPSGLPSPDAAQPAPQLDPDGVMASKPKGGRWKTLLLVFLGVAVLAGIGAALFYFFGDQLTEATDSSDTDLEAVGPGSFNEPHSRNTGVKVFYPDGDGEQTWVVEVIDPVRDATDEVVAAGGQEPATGSAYAAVGVRIRNDEADSETSLDDLDFNAVNADGDLIVRDDNACPLSGNDLDYGATVAVGDTVEGDVCFEVPETDIDGLLLGVESSKVAGRVHIDLD